MLDINNKKKERLIAILNVFPKIIGDSESKDGILKTFIFKKPLISIEIYDMSIEAIENFKEILKDYFFIEYVFFHPKSQNAKFSGLIFMSRFKNVLDVAISYAREHRGLLKIMHRNYRFIIGSHYTLTTLIENKVLTNRILKYFQEEQLINLDWDRVNILSNRHKYFDQYFDTPSEFKYITGFLMFNFDEIYLSQGFNPNEVHP